MQVEEYQQQGFLSPIDVMSEDEASGYLQLLQAAESEHPRELNAENRSSQAGLASRCRITCPPAPGSSWARTTGCRCAASSCRRILSSSSGRPAGDMDPSAAVERCRANDNWADILYQGAQHKRAY